MVYDICCRTHNRNSCGQYDNKLDVCDWLTIIGVVWSQKMTGVKKTHECHVECVIANNEQKTTVNRQQSKSYIQLKVSDTNT